MRSTEKLTIHLEQILIGLVFITLAAFTYVNFFKILYFGFDFSNGYIVELHTELENSQLHIGDRLVKVGEVHWDDFNGNTVETLFENVAAGDTVLLLVEREGIQLSIPWTIPGINRQAILAQLVNNWWLAYVFWLAAAVTYLFVRPRDTRWHLLIAFNLLTALWLSAGSISRWHIWYSSLILKTTIWMCIPVYWHLHWLFPRPLSQLPSKLIWGGYIISGILIVLELLQVLPPSLYLLGFLLAIAGILALLIAHVMLQPDQRESLQLLIKIVPLLLLPIIVGSFAALMGNFNLISLSLLGLPLLPIAYIYVIYRHRLGKLELRANRVIILYLYFIVLLSFALLVGVFFSRLFDLPGNAVLLVLVTTTVIGILTVLLFPGFERFVERQILGFSLPPSALLETYAMEIVTKLDKAELIKLVKEQVLPTLSIRESAVIYWGEELATPVIFTVGIAENELPTAKEIALLLNETNEYRPIAANKEEQLCPWVRLSLPLNVGDKPVGLWLLGRRDPDDLYKQREIPTLQALAAQTAIALANILQTENLHRLYQANIDNQESERTHLALELHDDILNQMALLAIYVDEQNVAPQFFEVFDKLTMRFRQTIRGLRPAMLNYGLRAALDDLVDQLPERMKDGMLLEFAVPPSTVRYPVNMEQHIFRIVQQAVENCLQHAEASKLRIDGYLEPQKIYLVIEDNGQGFLAGEQLNLSSLLISQHFGLIGMYERAALIGAEVKIDSAVNGGTRVSISWSKRQFEVLNMKG